MIAVLVRRAHGSRWKARPWRRLEISGEVRKSTPELKASSTPWPSSSPAWPEAHNSGIPCISTSPGFCRQRPPALLPLIAHWDGPSGCGPGSPCYLSRSLHLGWTTGQATMASHGPSAASSMRQFSQASAQRLVPRGGSRTSEGRFSWKPLTLLWRSAVIASEIATLWVRRYTEPNIVVRATKFREALIRLGPFYVKLGQALSTRPDILPQAYCQELSRLQDRMPPFPNKTALAAIQAQLGRPASQVFAEISSEPVAAASLGQVYRGRLHSGEEVAIKIQRPGAEANLALDRQILKAIARVLQRYLRGDTDLEAIVDELVGRLFEEMDYEQEGRNAELFAELYCGSGLIKAPRIFWPFTSHGVLTMEWIDGFKLTDSEALRGAKLSPRRIVDIGVWCSLRQVLDCGFFHADPHPGNLAVTPSGQLVYFDFGMMSHLKEEARYGLIRALVHYVNKDGMGLAKDFDSLGFLPKNRDLETIGAALQQSMDQGPPPAAPQGLSSASSAPESGSLPGTQPGMDFQGVLAQLSEVMLRFRFHLPPEFSLVIRALGSLEGTATAVSPGFKVVASAYPFVMGRLLEDRSPAMRAVLRDILMFPNGAVRWNRVRRMISVLESAESSQSTDRRESSSSSSSSARALGPPKGVSQQHAAAAAEYLLDFVFSGQGAQTRSWLTLDLLLSYKQGLSLLTRTRQADGRALESREKGKETENALQVQDLVKAVRATALAGSSAPEVWMPLANTVVTRTEFREMVTSLGRGIVSATVEEVETTALTLVSRLVGGRQSRHSS